MRRRKTGFYFLVCSFILKGTKSKSPPLKQTESNFIIICYFHIKWEDKRNIRDKMKPIEQNVEINLKKQLITGDQLLGVPVFKVDVFYGETLG